MDSKLLFTKILGLKPPWFIKEIAVKEEENSVHIYLEHGEDIVVRYPVCDEFCGVYDHSPERIFCHLDACNMQTFFHVRLPRSNFKGTKYLWLWSKENVPEWRNEEFDALRAQDFKYVEHGQLRRI
ncbi:MAG: hypothetical protein SVW57_07100 [Thermodesulfobacteriota bacterium]|nr:hypothetical protein [Thermodesulfobacteriota bacterium]